MEENNIYDYVKSEETNYIAPIVIEDGWNWSMKEHLRKSLLYKNSQFTEANDDRKNRPFKNIIRAILRVHYRTEGFDVKDINLYINDDRYYYKSFLVKKYHEEWALENKIDTFIDEMVNSFVDYGGVLVKNTPGVRPEVVTLQTLAFCDQSDILSGPFGIKHHYSPGQLREQESVGWGTESGNATMAIDTLIGLAGNSKQQDKEDQPNKTPGKYIEVYEVHGTFDDSWIPGGTYGKYTKQMHVVAFYKDENGDKQGVTLYAKRTPKELFKFLSRDKIFGRALGLGGVEELFEDQIWTNEAEIKITEMLDAASKILHVTDDKTFKTQNNLSNKKNNDVLVVDEGKSIRQMDTTPRNLAVFNDAVERWNQHAQSIGSANEALQGESPSAGTPFKLQELVTMEGKGDHKERQGWLAVFLDEIYRDWIIPQIEKEIHSDKKFLSELSPDEFGEVMQAVVRNRATKWAIDQMFKGNFITPDQMDGKKQLLQQQLTEGGNKVFLKWFKDDFKNAPVRVKTNIAGKQKNLAMMTDKIVNVIRQFIATPELRQDPEMVKLLNVILESSGLSPIMFGGATRPQPQQPQQSKGNTSPLKDLAEGEPQPA